MKFGQGRPPKRLEIWAIREVGIEELRSTERGRDPAVKRFRDYHHQMARLFASGMTSGQVAHVMGMSWVRVCIFQNDQAFGELVRHYRESPDPSWREVNFGVMAQMQLNHAEAVRLQAEQFEEVREGKREIPAGTLARIVSDLSDRVGFGKNQTITVEHSFAAKLDKAIERSRLKVIEGKAESVSMAPLRVSTSTGSGKPESDEGVGSSSVPKSPLAPPVRPKGVAPSIPSSPKESRRA